MRVSVIITTYNRIPALAVVLSALARQTMRPIEVIVADDGSSDATRIEVERIAQNYYVPLLFCWQEDLGFRAARIRNKAAKLASGDYLIYIDGDCVPLPNFIERHCSLAEKGYFVAGNRVLLNERLTSEIENNPEVLNSSTKMTWIQRWLKSEVNRLHPFLYLPRIPRKNNLSKWQGVKTCNLGLWRSDLIAVNGFDESFLGWGHEDADLAIRLIRYKIYRKDGKFAIPVIHLWHKENSRLNEAENVKKLNNVLLDNRIRSIVGIAEHDIERDSK